MDSAYREPRARGALRRVADGERHRVGVRPISGA